MSLPGIAVAEGLVAVGLVEVGLVEVGLVEVGALLLTSTSTLSDAAVNCRLSWASARLAIRPPTLAPERTRTTILIVTG